MSEYAERNPMALEPYYSRHVSAMTVESLHSKSDIAVELSEANMLIGGER